MTVRFREIVLLSSLSVTSSYFPARAQNPCTNPAVIDIFIQGGQQVIDAGDATIKSLDFGEIVPPSEHSLTCRYLMLLTDGSERYVRFTYSIDRAGQPSIDYMEETTNSQRNVK